MEITVKWLDLTIKDLTNHEIKELSSKLSRWQKNQQFMNFLKDVPMSPRENQNILETKLAEEHNIHKVIIDKTRQEIIGSVLFDQFDNEDMSLESYTRVDPECKGWWIGSQCRKAIIAEILSSTDIQKIISRHSARNRWSFIINKRAWFRLVDFAPHQTYLPNIGKITDDFKREIHKGQKIQSPGEIVDLEQKNIKRIMEGIQKYDLSHLL